MNITIKSLLVKHRFLLLLALLFLGASLAFFYWNKTPQSAIHKDQPQVAKKEIKYVCPMHPQVVENHPGKCPICGMDLEERVDSNNSEMDLPAQDSPAQNVTPSKHSATSLQVEGHAAFPLSILGNGQTIGLTWGKVEKKKLFKEILASGRVAFDPDLYMAQKEYQEATLQMERVKNSPLEEVKKSARKMWESAQLRLKVLGLSDQQIQNLTFKSEKLSKQESDDAQGNTDSSNDENLLVSEKGKKAWIYAEVFEMDLPFIQPGLSVQMTGGNFLGKSHPGKVISVDRVLNPSTRTARVRIQSLDSTLILRPETFLNVTILSPLGEKLAIPWDAVLDSGKEAWVFVQEIQPDGEGKVVPRRIEIESHVGNEVIVLQGLNEGEMIVTSGNFLIDSESRIQFTTNSSTAPSTTGTQPPTTNPTSGGAHNHVHSH